MAKTNAINNELPDLTINKAYSFPTSDGSAGQVLETDGSGNLTFSDAGKDAVSINFVTFTSSGTYTAPSNLLFAKVELVGGGGGGAGSPGTGSGQWGAGGAGGGAPYAASYLNASTIGASQTVTVGSGGAGGAAGQNAGSNGGSSSFGSLVAANGGSRGQSDAIDGSRVMSSTFQISVATAGQIQTNGNTGGITISGGGGPGGCIGEGGSSFLGGSGRASAFKSQGRNGRDGANSGMGASGSATMPNESARPGGDGFRGVVYITEYLSS